MTSPAFKNGALWALHFGFYTGFLALRSCFQPVPMPTALILALLLVWISVIDVERFEIPDTASALLALTGGVFAYQAGEGIFIDHIVGGVLWAGLFWLVAGTYARWRGWQGLGFGDVKLMLGIGFWLGLNGTTAVVFSASIAGVLAILGGSVTGYTQDAKLDKTGIAFGPFLCLSTWIVWLFKDLI
jgi:prepilin signal peptidase PulO-like enzyme (type II secretory pathway)